MKQVFFNVGDVVASYRIESFVARGGMAMVYRARDTRLDRSVALKLLAPELSQNDTFRQRFIRESQLAAACDHPNIIPIYEAGEVEDRLFIAMRYVEGLDLRALLDEEGALQMDRALDLVFQVGSALDAAHTRGLVHRDVKPGNILVASGAGRDETDHVYLTDFGLTKRSMSLTGYTTAGHFLGTIDYIAPEQIAGKAVDARADIYALGCVLYEALATVPPFQRDDDAALLWAHLSAPPPRVTERRPDLAEEVNQVFARALAKEPDDRFRTCREFLNALRPSLTRSAAADFEHHPANAAAAPPVGDSLTADQDQPTLRPLAAPPVLPAAARDGGPHVSTSNQRPARWRLPIVVAAVVVVLAVIAGGLLLRTHSDSLSKSLAREAVPFSFRYPGSWVSKPSGVEVVSSPNLEEACRLFSFKDWSQLRRTAPEGRLGLYASYNTKLAVPADLEMNLKPVLPNVKSLTRSSGDFHVDGVMAYVYEGDLADPDSRLNLRFRTYVVPAKSAQFTFFANSDSFRKELQLFERMVKTVDFR